MGPEQLQKIITHKNEALERSALGSAEAMIEAIIKHQKAISHSQACIEEIRKDLRALEVEALDPRAVLGGE